MMYSENDISNSIKNGILYLEDPVNHVRAGPGGAGPVRDNAVRGLCDRPASVSSRSGIPTTLF